ncbi:hypothetical protein Tco_1306005 [Tanacetum coccineum]
MLVTKLVSSLKANFLVVLVGRRFNDVTPKACHVETNNQDSSEDTIDEHGGDVESSSCCDTAYESIKHLSHDHELKLAHVKESFLRLSSPKTVLTWERNVDTLALFSPKHEHPIELSDESDISCDICKEDIAKGSPRYNCTDKCQCNVHTTCAISPPVRTTEGAQKNVV